MATALVALATTTLASASATVTFSSISGAYRDLRLVVSYKHTTTNAQAVIRINGDTASNYSVVGMAGWPSAASSWSTAANAIACMNYSAPDSAQVVPLLADFMDYSATDKHKTVLLRSNHFNEVDAVAARWANTSAITSILIYPDGGQFAIGSTFSLYGVLA